MVALLTLEEDAAIAAAIAEAEKRTAAEIVAVITPASDNYLDMGLAFGLMFGSSISLLLWMAGLVTYVPELLAIQLALIMLTCRLLPFSQALYPQVLASRSKRRAQEEYSAVAHQLPPGIPLALLFISLKEHQAHIISSPLAAAHIADEQWQQVIGQFTQSVSTKGLPASCIAAIAQIGELAATAFAPGTSDDFDFSNQVLEKR